MRTIAPKTDDDRMGFVGVALDLEIGLEEAEGWGDNKV